jgi:hypothetical protein
MMTILESWTIQANARKDAKAGVESCEDRVKASLGERPAFDPSRLDHKRIEEDLHLDGEINNLENEVAGLEDQLAAEPGVLVNRTAVVGCYLAEAWACISLMGSYGFRNPEKTVFGVMLALFIFWITAMLSHVSGRRRIGAYVMYAALVVAVAGSRLDERGDGAAINWAEAVVLMFLTIGPAMFADWCLRRIHAAAALAKKLRVVRPRLARLRGRRDRAQAIVDKIHEAQRQWDNEATRTRSVYWMEHRRQLAPRGAVWPPYRAAGTN